MKLVFLVFLACSMSCSLGGKCPRYPLIKDFRFSQYLGMWFQQDKRQSGWEVPGRCWRSVYLQDPTNGQFKLRMIFENTLTQREESYDSQISLATPRRPSIIKYTIPLTFFENELQVLATDYDTFSIEYKCDANGILEKQESIFLLTRKKNPTPLVLQRAYAIMHRYGIDIRKLERVDQTCGGVELKQKDVVDDYTNYDYYPSPDQDIKERDYDTYSQGFNNDGYIDSDTNSRRDYQNGASGTVENYYRPSKRRFQVLPNPEPESSTIWFGKQLADRFKSLMTSVG